MELRDLFKDLKTKRSNRKATPARRRRRLARILSSPIRNRRIGYLSPPAEGKRHDYGMFKDLFLLGIFPKDVTLWLDLGFTGVDKDYPDATVMMPKKKPKGKELTDEDKARNKVISGIRVIVEYAIGGIKRFRITTDKFRNKKDTFNDKAMLLSCGLWNYHLTHC